VWHFLRRLFRRPSTESLGGLDPQQTRLIVGLGNPGPEYADTRHNLGFRCVEELARRYGAAWQDKTSAWSSLIAVVHPCADDPSLTVVLAKPQTYMNRSGAAVRALLGFLGLAPDPDPEKGLIVYDDMDLPFGTLRLRQRGSAGTHNGMRSVVASLQSDDIPRLRIGISQASPGEATSHVLSEFSADERHAVDELVKRAADAALAWAVEGPEMAMNRYNSSVKT
jgi:PTH1 family peptidyl-tRNA hydrolase